MLWEAKAAVSFQPPFYVRHRRENMARDTEPSRQDYDEHYPEVLKRAGLTRGDDRVPEFERRIREIFNGYWAGHGRPTIAIIQEALERYIKGRVMVRDAMKTLDLFHREIATAADLADLSPEDREGKIKEYLDFCAELDHLSIRELEQWGDIEPLVDLDDLTLERDRGIEFLRDNPDSLARLLKRETGDYRKDAETALVVEPALDLLDSIGVTPTKKLTRKAFFDALFNLLGIRKRRPTPARISVIVDNRKKKPRPVAT
jgi:hypothetical protein